MGLKERDLSEIAQARFDDAETLLSGDRFDGAVYLAGYVIELALKAKIVAVHNFDFPESDSEKKQTFQFNGKRIERRELWSHDLSKLAKYAGFNTNVPNVRAIWSLVKQWHPTECRYKIGIYSETDARQLLTHIENLWKSI